MRAITNKQPGPSGPQRGQAISKSLAGEGDELGSERDLIRIARDILDSRRQRNREFGKRLFSEPAWDMLLELYARENAGLAATTLDLISASGAAKSTARRWIAHLEKELLINRRAHPQEPGVDFVELTDLGRESLERFLAAIQSDQE